MTPRLAALFLPIMVAAGCHASGSGSSTACGAAGGSAAGSHSTASAVAAPVSSDTHADTAQAELDRMDTRTPVPLLAMMANHQKRNMRDHLVAVQEMVAALAVKDFAGVENAARRIGYSEQMGMMCTHMGAGAAGFTDAALNFHHTADRIAEAAKAKDEQRVLGALAETLSTCASCHATFKQRVVTDTEWTAITTTAHGVANESAPPMHEGMAGDHGHMTAP